MTDGGRMRARHSGFVSPLTRHPVFRIEDGEGRVLRRISSARDAAEAMAHYWRGSGADASFSASMPELPPDASLQRRIGKARAARGRGTAGHEAMQTHELPLPELPADAVAADETEAETAPERPAAPARRRAAPTRPKAADLFETPDPSEPPVAETIAGPDEAVAAPVSEPQPEPEQEPESEPEPGAEPVSEPRPAAVAVAVTRPAAAAPYHLDAQQVMLARIDHRNLRPTDRPDSWLYHVSNRSEAELALRNGLVVSANDPVILTERAGVAYWLSVLAEDFDVILDGPADFVVLRLRRIAVESLLEPDPDASRSAGCACYLLTGGETKLSA